MTTLTPTRLTREQLIQKTEEAQARIHRETYATTEDIDAFFAELKRDSQQMAVLQSSVTVKSNKGEWQCWIRIGMTARMIRGLGLGYSSNWLDFERHRPENAKRFKDLVDQFADVEITSIDVRGMNPKVVIEEPAVWLMLDWHKNRPDTDTSGADDYCR